MTELYFLRHGTRADHDPDVPPLVADYKDYDPSLSESALLQMELVANEIADASQNLGNGKKKSVFIHFLPYLRCVQSADLLLTNLKQIVATKFPDHPRIRFQLLGDFALSEWIHEKMVHKPPYFDSNDAYEMYSPNLTHVVNKSSLSNFRPTVTLGQWNGHDLSFKNYQSRSKEYFKKLLATYDTPSHIKNDDIVIVISHGYMINSFLSFFISRPIFEEIPEAKLNFAEKKDTWKLTKDALGLIEKEDLDTSLNLETDIVYYKTNFIKKSDLNVNETVDQPRESFMIKLTLSQPDLTKLNRPIFPSTKDWTPQLANKYMIKTEFKLKVMKDEAFKKSFNLRNHPLKPVTPEISPNSNPSRQNSVIDLAKLSSNEDIYKPMKLKYSTTAEIPIERLNSKVNSQLNLSTINTNFNSTAGLFKLNSRGSLSSVNDTSSPVLSNPSAIPINSQINLSHYLRSPASSSHNLDSSIITTPINSLIEENKVMTSFREPKFINSPNESSNESISLQKQEIRLVGSTLNPAPEEIPTVKPKKPMVFNFDGSDSEEDEDEKKYMWFGGNL
jgi:broad specificity phosphatase PhoE